MSLNMTVTGDLMMGKSKTYVISGCYPCREEKGTQ